MAFDISYPVNDNKSLSLWVFHLLNNNSEIIFLNVKNSFYLIFYWFEYRNKTVYFTILIFNCYLFRETRVTFHFGIFHFEWMQIFIKLYSIKEMTSIKWKYRDRRITLCIKKFKKKKKKHADKSRRRIYESNEHSCHHPIFWVWLSMSEFACWCRGKNKHCISKRKLWLTTPHKYCKMFHNAIFCRTFLQCNSILPVCPLHLCLLHKLLLNVHYSICLFVFLFVSFLLYIFQIETLRFSPHFSLNSSWICWWHSFNHRIIFWMQILNAERISLFSSLWKFFHI